MPLLARLASVHTNTYDPSKKVGPADDNGTKVYSPTARSRLAQNQSGSWCRMRQFLTADPRAQLAIEMSLEAADPTSGVSMTTPIQRYFDKLAEVYDLATTPAEAWTAPKQLADFAAPALFKGCRLLDIGVGTGQSLMELQRLEPDLEAWGLDPSVAMIDRCQAKLPMVTLLCADLASARDQLPTDFDVIVACGVTEFIADLDGWLHEVKTILKPGGALVFTYEPRIAGHPIQVYASSLVTLDHSSRLYQPDCLSYRRSAEEVSQALSSAQLHAVRERAFVAYRKHGQNILYRLLACGS